MEALAAGDVFLFGGFRLDRRGGGLFRRDAHGDFVPMTNQRRPAPTTCGNGFAARGRRRASVWRDCRRY
jgi:hypothetical protein